MAERLIDPADLLAALPPWRLTILVAPIDNFSVELMMPTLLDDPEGRTWGP